MADAASMLQEVRAAYPAVSQQVLDALGAVHRHLFLPQVPVDTAYRDDAIVTKRDADGMPISSSSQPTIMAIMLDQLEVRPGDRVLEIGAGTGYNAALLHRLVGEHGSVVSVDIDRDVLDEAAANLALAGVEGVRLVHGDGFEGFADLAPYDRIIATVGVWDLAPAWLAQLAPGGRLVLPLDLRGVQCSVAFERVDEHWRSTSVVGCGFMRMRGTLTGPERTVLLGEDGELSLTVPGGHECVPAALLDALSGPPVLHATTVGAGERRAFQGLSLWLAVREPQWCTVSEMDSARVHRLPPGALHVHDRLVTAGVVAGGDVAVLSWPADSARLVACGYGPRGGEFADRLAGHVDDWYGAHQPTVDTLVVEAFPVGTPNEEFTGRQVVDKTYTRLVLSDRW